MSKSNLENTGLPTDSIQKIQHIFSHYPEIKKVYLYGSRAKGNFQAGSDIDLSIISDDFSYTQLIKLEIELDDLLLPYKLDINLFKNIENRELTAHIKRCGIVFYLANYL